MNKVLGYILLAISILGCDTVSNIKPLGEDYFIKFYGSVGDQEGVAVKSTSDGGFIIGGNSTPEFGGQSDFFLLKVDAFGNQEWLETYDYNGTIENDLLTDVLVVDNGYIISGTSTIKNIDKMVLMQIDGSGNLNKTLTIDAQSNFSYQNNSVSVTSSGDLLVAGPIIGGDPAGIDPDDGQYGKSFISVINSDLEITSSTAYPQKGSVKGKETVFVKGLEALNSTTNQLDYVFFGYKNSSSVPFLNIYQFDSELGSGLAPEAINYNESKIVDVIKISETQYKLLSASENESYLIDAIETSFGYELKTDQSVKTKEDLFISAVSLSYTSTNQFLIASNVKPANSDITSSSIQESSVLGLANWLRVFGTDISYTSGGVIAMADGSVVYTGTAGFKGQRKAFLIKLKSNGEMK